MKKNLLFILMLTFSIGLFAQDWAPINTSERFCYSSDDTLDMINNVLWVESFEQVDDIQAYYLNKITIPFENGEGSLFLYNQPQFLLDDIWVYPDGNWVFQDTFFLPIEELESYTLKPGASLSTTWDFATNITATITEIGVMDLFGEEDSIKTISVSNGLEIVLSKEHGIVNWNNEYQLIGIEGRDLGFQVPNFEDMYADISEGDVVCVNRTRAWADGEVHNIQISERIEIESITWYEDSLEIYAYVRSKYLEWNPGYSLEFTEGYRTITKYRTSFTDAYPNELLYFEDYSLTISEGFLISKLSHHKWGGLMKSQVLFEAESMGVSSSLYQCEGLYSYELCPIDYGDFLKVEHSTKYGFLELLNWGFEWSAEVELTGYLHDGDTLGYIYPLDVFLGQQELASSNNFQIYPSPAKESIKIQTHETGEINYHIFNISGQLIMEGRMEKSFEDLEIDISELQNGIYILQFDHDHQVSRSKFIKQK